VGEDTHHSCHRLALSPRALSRTSSLFFYSKAELKEERAKDPQRVSLLLSFSVGPSLSLSLSLWEQRRRAKEDFWAKTMRLPDGGDPCAHVSAETVRMPPKDGAVRVYKEECTQCFASVDGEDGILVCASCFNGGCEKHAARHATAHKHPCALRMHRKRKADDSAAADADSKGSAGAGDDAAAADADMKDAPTPDRVRIEPTQESFEWEWEACCIECGGDGSWTPVDRKDSRLTACAQEVLETKSAAQADNVKAWENVRIQCEHTVMLEQPPKESAPQLAAKSLAHCSECELSNNLWLCMTCGHLGCGRRNWDGSGGHNHAVDHNETSGHHVVCKLGTITAEGDADIHCYRCDEERLDPMLAEHMARFGIDISSQSKTEQTMAELEAAQNLDPSLFSKGGDGLHEKLVYGPGYTGLANLGNTCYMASTLQAVMDLPEFRQRYYGSGNAAQEHIDACDNVAPAECFLCQTHKLAHGMLSGEHSVAPEAPAEGEDVDDQEGIPPRMFKSLLCRDHPEFSSMQQQDAEEFFQFMLESFRAREGRSTDPTTTFDFTSQDRLQCVSCKKVRYMSTDSQTLALPVPDDKKVEDPQALAAAMEEEERLEKLRAEAAERTAAREKAEAEAAAAKEAADAKPAGEKKDGDDAAMSDAPGDKDGDSKEESKDEKKKELPPERQDLTRLERASYIPFSACTDAFAREEAVEFTCTECGSKQGALKRSRVSHFPDTLAVAMRRFTHTDWVPRKVGFQIRFDPDVKQTPADGRVVFDFEALRGAVPGANGEELMSSDGEGASAGPQLDMTAVAALEGMGFPRVRAERAVFETAGRGPEAAMEWLLMHSEDADIDKPLSEVTGGSGDGAGAGAAGAGAPPAAVSSLVDMGFSEQRALYALRVNDNDPERSVEWLFAHADDPIEEDPPAPEAGAAASESKEKPELDTKTAKYELSGFVEHRGTSTRSGHYVAYLFKDGRWVHFNDRKVCEADSPPTQFAYMYFFRRCEE
jgi:ubiquitin carboxyl-terminal hydrolase 5/13